MKSIAATLRAWLSAALLLCLSLGSLPPTRALAATEPTVVHMVSPGETLASIAELYYGDPKRESVLVAENGLTNEGGSAIVVGLRLVIPSVSHHRVQEGDTWASLATRFYGDPTRAFVLIDANSGSAGGNPDPGAEIVIPYPLRHVAAQTDTLRKIAKTYYPRIPGKGATTITRFNQLTRTRLARGQILLIPLNDLILSEAGKKLAIEHGTPPPPGGDVRARQAKIEAALPELREHVSGGRYADAVAMANRLIGGGDLTGSQTVTVYRELGEAMVALGRDDLAIEAFRRVLKQQPDAELDGVTTSPRVLAAFALAQKPARKPARAAGGDGDKKPPRKKKRPKKRDAKKPGKKSDKKKAKKG